MNVADVVSQYDTGIAVKRWVATIIDYAVFGVTIVLSSIYYGETTAEQNIIYILVGLILLQYIILEGLKGFTIGKLILGIRVVNIDGTSPGILKAIVRTLFRIIDVNPVLLGGLPAGLTVISSKYKQRFGDMAAKTYVINRQDINFLELENTEENRNIIKKYNAETLTKALIVLGILIGLIVVGGFVAGILAPSVFKQVEKARGQQHGKVITSTDGTFQVTVPYGWSDCNNANEGFELKMSDSGKNAYVAVSREKKTDFSKSMTLDKYYTLADKNLRSSIKEITIFKPTDIKINEHNAKQFEVSGEVDDMKAQYFLTLIDTPNDYYEIIEWTLQSEYAKNKEDFIDIANSFKELPQK